MIHNLIGFILATALFLVLITLFGLFWLIGTVGDKLTRLFNPD